ncbi:hypothetical protein C1N63_02865 [Pantoea ananatis]|nr:hypothetical protein C1N63_02865 [Pantoea ananatis]
MLSKTGFTHSDLLCWQSDYAGGSLNVNGTIIRDTYTGNCIDILMSIRDGVSHQISIIDNEIRNLEIIAS